MNLLWIKQINASRVFRASLKTCEGVSVINHFTTSASSLRLEPYWQASSPGSLTLLVFSAMAFVPERRFGREDIPVYGCSRVSVWRRLCVNLSVCVSVCVSVSVCVLLIGWCTWCFFLALSTTSGCSCLQHQDAGLQSSLYGSTLRPRLWVHTNLIIKRKNTAVTYCSPRWSQSRSCSDLWRQWWWVRWKPRSFELFAFDHNKLTWSRRQTEAPAESSAFWMRRH